MLKRIPNDYGEDTFKFVELIAKDVWWFNSHPTGEMLSERSIILEDYLCEKYRISDKCIGQISS